MARSLNQVELIGNLTRDPELRFTPQGSAVCNFGVATNRQWNTDAGEKKEDVEFHRIVAWNKLAELCAQLLSKGRKVYVSGRLKTRKWTGKDGVERSTTEIVINEMIILDSRGAASSNESKDNDVEDDFDIDEETMQEEQDEEEDSKDKKQKSAKMKKKKGKKKGTKNKKSKKDDDDDIPF